MSGERSRYLCRCRDISKPHSHFVLKLMADVSHELRTPLSVIRGNLEGIADGLYSAGPGRVHLLLEEVGVMARLVEDLHTLSLAEAGVLRIHREPGDLAALVENAVAAWQGRAAPGASR